MIFLILGGVLYFLPFPLPMFDLSEKSIATQLLEHFTEIIVIISLAGAGLAIDRKIGLKRWRFTWPLLLIVMPLTIIITALTGYYIMGFSVASALLLAACISPTDPVLARIVQVEEPHSGKEHDVRIALTTEAGLNDGLAFPFIYLAFTFYMLANNAFDNIAGTLTEWFLYDLLYRVGMGFGIGSLCGYGLARLIFSPIGDANSEENNAGLVLISSTFLTYGLAEFFEGYGFIAVFVAAVVGKMYDTNHDRKEYSVHPHRFSDQIEKILVAVLLIWIGYYIFAGGFIGLTYYEIGFAFAFIFLIRPVITFLSILPMKAPVFEKFAMSFLGVRGIGSLYYMLYAVNNHDFADIESLWRITLIIVVMSIFVHGISSGPIIGKLKKENNP